MNTVDGTLLWEAEEPHVISAPRAVGGVICVGWAHGQEHGAYGFKANDGTLLWSWRAPDTNGGIGVTSAEGLLFVFTDSLWCLDPASGEVAWRILDGLFPGGVVVSR